MRDRLLCRGGRLVERGWGAEREAYCFAIGITPFTAGPECGQAVLIKATDRPVSDRYSCTDFHVGAACDDVVKSRCAVDSEAVGIAAVDAILGQPSYIVSAGERVGAEVQTIDAGRCLGGKEQRGIDLGARPIAHDVKGDAVCARLAGQSDNLGGISGKQVEGSGVGPGFGHIRDQGIANNRCIDDGDRAGRAGTVADRSGDRTRKNREPLGPFRCERILRDRYAQLNRFEARGDGHSGAGRHPGRAIEILDRRTKVSV